MLQQILRDMWVDPEILAELDETQKQTLFCKMREEQVRRWQLWDEKVGKEDERPKFQKNGKKQVQFLTGEDGEPWVWVMGEHPEDKSIETILAEEAREKAIAQARQEVQQLRKSVEKELTQLIEYKPLDDLEQKFDLSPKTMDPLEDTLEIYCTVDELRQRIEALEPDVKIEPDEIDKLPPPDFTDPLKLDLSKNTLHFNFIEGKRDVLQDMGVGAGGDGVSVLVAAWERRVAAARAGDILRGIRAKRARAMRLAHHAAQTHDAAWRDQERKAKEAEASMREIARAAREAHRRSSHIAAPPDTTQAGKPPNREAIVEWFQTHELKRGVGLDENNKPVDWFHGLISRSEAETALSSCPAGSFLVRVSERVWGYAVTYRDSSRCKHYLVEAARAYRLLPTGHVAHDTLADLINYHKTVPITESGGELLVSACPPQQTPDILCAPPS
ncbi:SH2 domain-containing protein 4A-like [Helicoverpa zea]|uniref:SH2 domain-containing protein 4A-like n=1 Tax=Helicoverpa zea TaxID=7113 RepID=UPI001F575206|nr:SH2 domain-containing protein 4A-like [Helicoverpa zea]XP_047032413.1 SH2 domain-containing protein 4A-like [Helicoverpa zea]XP_047032414.1 SH2 domain-containing protein 4A-like [Helicoverpa zea]XP_047032415.1 SH2 domain-containing protein 4A-like [Helicoverpa zea]XP_047032416.1 SH2 domain-containing protein 4A-like [Helicoverpa zea]XP_047032417.1 SH2 domain-containing protein 4A-like [Helicoverpa zea]